MRVLIGDHVYNISHCSQIFPSPFTYSVLLDSQMTRIGFFLNFSSPSYPGRDSNPCQQRCTNLRDILRTLYGLSYRDRKIVDYPICTELLLR